VVTTVFDLNELIDQEFVIQGVRFAVRKKPAMLWMDQAFAPGANEFLKGRAVAGHYFERWHSRANIT